MLAQVCTENPIEEKNSFPAKRARLSRSSSERNSAALFAYPQRDEAFGRRERRQSSLYRCAVSRAARLADKFEIGKPPGFAPRDPTKLIKVWVARTREKGIQEESWEKDCPHLFLYPPHSSHLHTCISVNNHRSTTFLFIFFEDLQFFTGRYFVKVVAKTLWKGDLVNWREFIE